MNWRKNIAFIKFHEIKLRVRARARGRGCERVGLKIRQSLGMTESFKNSLP